MAISSLCIVTSPAALVDEYAELPKKIVKIQATPVKIYHSLRVVILMLAFSAMLEAPAFAQSTPQLEETISDILIVLDSDGRSHTVQHTVASNGPSLKLNLPGSVIPQEVMFFGPERELFTEQYKTTPATLEISSGSAFARYQHQYGVEVQQVQPGYFVLTTPSVPTNIDLVGEPLTHSSISWVFPSEFELVSYSVTDYSTGRWISINNTLTFYNAGTSAVELSINYRKNAGSLTIEPSACHDATSDTCAKDKDEDGIPDYRDACADPIGVRVNALGCAEDRAMMLSNIEFTTGKTYLDVTARILLDKVAQAILKSDYTFFEIGAHTDNNGATSNNQLLSDRRADAVRHYLMLKGVHPNTLRATGYGEQYPIRDNSSADGQRANRRIELVIIN